MVATEPNQCWSCLARELRDALAAREIPFVRLDQAGIHPEMVRRLQQSLSSYASFPMLIPDELDRVMVYFAFSAEEILRTRTAVVVTAVQRVLFKRLSPGIAVQANDDLFPIVLEAMRLNRMAGVRHDEEEECAFADEDGIQLAPSAHPQDADERDDDVQNMRVALDEIFDALDRGALALHDSDSGQDQRDCQRAAQAAHVAFTQALTGLQALQPGIAALPGEERTSPAPDVPDVEATQGLPFLAVAGPVTAASVASLPSDGQLSGTASLAVWREQALTGLDAARARLALLGGQGPKNRSEEVGDETAKAAR